MYVGIDDTDNKNEMCTTYIISQIARNSRYDIIGYPGLVRLNPNISHKTRGNGALNINLGKGAGNKKIIGKINDKYVYSYDRIKEEPDAYELMDLIYGIVSDYYVKEDENTNPGIVVSSSRFHPQLYMKALEDDIRPEFIENYLDGRAIYRKINNGHGIIGAAASLAWPAEKITYELLDYKYPHYNFLQRDTKLSMASIPEKYESTFNNIDYANNYPAIFPKFKTPVIFGIRGVNSYDLLKIYDEMKANYNIKDEGFIIFETNQGTDDHIINEPEYLFELGSYSITVVVSSYPYNIHGGHYFIGAKYKNIDINLAAFEPTKDFRKIIWSLIPGDVVKAYGSYSMGTIKLEKIKIISLSKNLKTEPPVCPNCRVKTKSKGKLDYRCPVCRRRYKNPEIYIINRKIKEGFYEVPIIARRHLTMPLKLINYFGEENDMYNWNSSNGQNHGV